METITETVITESAMIGHNPSTPGGQGLGQGRTIALQELARTSPNHQPWIVIVPGAVEFKDAAAQINAASSRGVSIAGAIVQKDDACSSTTGWRSRCRSWMRSSTSTVCRWECRRLSKSPGQDALSRSSAILTTSQPFFTSNRRRPSALCRWRERSWERVARLSSRRRRETSKSGVSLPAKSP